MVRIIEELSFVNKKGGTELTEITTKVEIADRTGHTTLQLTQSETLERVSGLEGAWVFAGDRMVQSCLLYTSPSPRDRQKSRMPSSA